MMSPSPTRVCEVCAQPMEAGAKAIKVGACEFPFYVHDGCRDSMKDVAGFVEDLCRLSEEQPDGLLYLGSWDQDPLPEDARPEVPGGAG